MRSSARRVSRACSVPFCRYIAPPLHMDVAALNRCALPFCPSATADGSVPWPLVVSGYRTLAASTLAASTPLAGRRTYVWHVRSSSTIRLDGALPHGLAAYSRLERPLLQFFLYVHLHARVLATFVQMTLLCLLPAHYA